MENIFVLAPIKSNDLKYMQYTACKAVSKYYFYMKDCV